MQTKLTLRLDHELIERAKAYARRTGKSVSEVVADFFIQLEARKAAETAPRSPAFDGRLDSWLYRLRRCGASRSGPPCRSSGYCHA